jgi:hypothetical protein
MIAIVYSAESLSRIITEESTVRRRRARWHMTLAGSRWPEISISSAPVVPSRSVNFFVAKNRDDFISAGSFEITNVFEDAGLRSVRNLASARTPEA